MEKGSIQNKRNYAIDIGKFICACLVVAIHAEPFYDIWPVAGLFLTKILARIAVPFFFIVSGYFMMDKIRKQKRSKAATIIGILRFYIIFSAFYFLWDLINGGYTEVSPAEMPVIVIKRFLFYGIYYHLWYFPCAILSLLILYFCGKHNCVKPVFMITVVVYLFGAFSYTWCEIGTEIFPPLNVVYRSFNFEYIRRFCCDALPFTFAGGYICVIYERLSHISLKTINYIILGLFCCNTAEIAFAVLNHIENGTTLSVFLMPLVCMIFIGTLRIRISDCDKAGHFCRTASVCIYGMHPFVLDILRKTEIFYSTTMIYFAVLLICLILTIVFLKMGGKGENIVWKGKH